MEEEIGEVSYNFLHIICNRIEDCIVNSHPVRLFSTKVRKTLGAGPLLPVRAIAGIFKKALVPLLTKNRTKPTFDDNSDTLLSVKV